MHDVAFSDFRSLCCMVLSGAESPYQCSALCAWQALVQQGGRAKPDFVAALGRVPRGLRTMYVHAVQSWLWNCAAAARCAQHGAARAVRGDLVLPQAELAPDEAAQDEAGECAPA